jgi:hypothetical protein
MVGAFFIERLPFWAGLVAVCVGFVLGLSAARTVSAAYVGELLWIRGVDADYLNELPPLHPSFVPPVVRQTDEVL